MRYFVCICMISFLLSESVKAQDSLRVMFYNVWDFPGYNGVPSREDTLGFILDATGKPDILAVCEMDDPSGVDSILQHSLNTNGVSHFQSALWVPNQSVFNNLQNMLFFNSNKLTLYTQGVILTDLRDISKYVLYLNDPGLAIHGDTTWLDVYITHLKASSGAGNEARRKQEIDSLRKYVDLEPVDRNRIFAADLNIYSATEAAYQTLTGGVYPFYDPIASSGPWHNNIGFAPIHTQSTRLAQLMGAGSGGGMDDRFDHLVVSAPVLTGSEGISYIPGSFLTIGNDGNHYNTDINQGTNSVVGLPMANALYHMSDHLPLVIDLQVDFPVLLGVGENGEAENVDEIETFRFLNTALRENELILEGESPQSSQLVISLKDLSGRELVAIKLKIPEGHWQVEKEISGSLSAGMYILSVYDLRSGESVVQKWVFP